MAEIFGPARRMDAWARWTAFLGFVGLLAVAAVVVVDVLLRWLFGAPLDGVDDVSQLAFAVIVVACFPAGLLQGHNITIRFLGLACGARASHWLEAFGALLTLVFFVFVAWQFVVLTEDLKASGDTTMTVQAITWPWWTVATAIMVSCVPVQAAVVAGHLRRAVTGSGPGGTIEPDDDAGADQIGREAVGEG